MQEQSIMLMNDHLFYLIKGYEYFILFEIGFKPGNKKIVVQFIFQFL